MSLTLPIIYSGVFIAACAGVGGFEVPVIVELDRFLDEGVSLHFVFIGADEEVLFVAYPDALAFVIWFAIDDPVHRNQVVDFVDGVVLDIEYLVQFIVIIDIDGIFSAVDRKVPSVFQRFPVVFRDLADLGGVDFPVGNVDGFFFDIAGKARLVQVHTVEVIACPVIFDGIDHPVLFLIETIRQRFAGHDEGVVFKVCREIIEQGLDAINRMGIQKRRC